MANLQMRGTDNDPCKLQRIQTPAKALLNMSESWEDKRTADEITREIRENRKNSWKLQDGF